MFWYVYECVWVCMFVWAYRDLLRISSPATKTGGRPSSNLIDQYERSNWILGHKNDHHPTLLFRIIDSLEWEEFKVLIWIGHHPALRLNVTEKNICTHTTLYTVMYVMFWKYLDRLLTLESLDFSPRVLMLMGQTKDNEIINQQVIIVMSHIHYFIGFVVLDFSRFNQSSQKYTYNLRDAQHVCCLKD